MAYPATRVPVMANVPLAWQQSQQSQAPMGAVPMGAVPMGAVQWLEAPTTPRPVGVQSVAGSSLQSIAPSTPKTTTFLIPSTSVSNSGSKQELGSASTAATPNSLGSATTTDSRSLSLNSVNYMTVDNPNGVQANYVPTVASMTTSAASLSSVSSYAASFTQRSSLNAAFAKPGSARGSLKSHPGNAMPRTQELASPRMTTAPADNVNSPLELSTSDMRTGSKQNTLVTIQSQEQLHPTSGRSNNKYADRLRLGTPSRRVSKGPKREVSRQLSREPVLPALPDDDEGLKVELNPKRKEDYRSSGKLQYHIVNEWMASLREPNYARGGGFSPRVLGDYPSKMLEEMIYAPPNLRQENGTFRQEPTRDTSRSRALSRQSSRASQSRQRSTSVQSDTSRRSESEDRREVQVMTTSDPVPDQKKELNRSTSEYAPNPKPQRESSGALNRRGANISSPIARNRSTAKTQLGRSTDSLGTPHRRSLGHKQPPSTPRQDDRRSTLPSTPRQDDRRATLGEGTPRQMDRRATLGESSPRTRDRRKSLGETPRQMGTPRQMDSRSTLGESSPRLDWRKTLEGKVSSRPCQS